MLLIIVSGCEVPTQSSDKVTPELSGISAYLPLEGTSAIPIITSQTEADANKQAFQKITKGQAMNRITAYLKTKQGPHLITSSRKNAQEENYRYAEKGVTIPDVLARKANGKEITYVYTERTAEGKVMQMAMVRIPDTPEIRTLVAKWFRNGISRRDPSREGRVLKTSMANPLPGVLSDTCQLDPDEVDPRCIDNEQYFDQDLGMYVLCDIIVCDDELVGEGDGGGSPNAPDDECTIACDPGWGEPGGGGSGGINFPSNPSHWDVFTIVEADATLTPFRYRVDYDSWISPELDVLLNDGVSTSSIPFAFALPALSGTARVLGLIATGAITVTVGEVVVGALLIGGTGYAIYSAFATPSDLYFLSRLTKQERKFIEWHCQKMKEDCDMYGNYSGIYNHCQNCKYQCINSGGNWPYGMCGWFGT